MYTLEELSRPDEWVIPMGIGLMDGIGLGTVNLRSDGKRKFIFEYVYDAFDMNMRVTGIRALSSWHGEQHLFNVSVNIPDARIGYEHDRTQILTKLAPTLGAFYYPSQL